MKAWLTDEHKGAVEEAIRFCERQRREEQENLRRTLDKKEAAERKFKKIPLALRWFLKNEAAGKQRIAAVGQARELARLREASSDLARIKFAIEATGKAEVDGAEFARVEAFLKQKKKAL